jgi:ATP-dependent DNA helicase RecG
LILLSFVQEDSRPPVAVCHREYLAGAHIQVRLYDDRLEIWNPGGLPATLKPADLLQDHDSIPRNPKIASAFFLAGLIEQWGTGTIHMAAALKEAGHSSSGPPTLFCSMTIDAL